MLTQKVNRGICGVLILAGFNFVLPGISITQAVDMGVDSGYKHANPDNLFEKELYQEALEKYKVLIEKSQGHEKLKAIYRATECEALLFRYGEALKRIFNEKLPEDPVWKARFLILRAETAREFLNQYGYSLPTDVKEDAREPEERTKKHWEKDILSSYEGLWELRQTLVNVSIKNESYFIDLKNADTSQTPTLWDFAVMRWTDYLFESVKEPKPSAASFLPFEYKRKFSSSDSVAEQAASIFEESSNLVGKNRQAARELWKIKRLLIPFDYQSHVQPFKDIEKSRDYVINLLKNWMDTFKTHLSRSKAGYKAGVLLHQAGRLKEAVEMCNLVEKNFSNTQAAKKCSKLRSQIEMPSLDLDISMAPPPGQKSMKIRVRNIPTVHFRLYKTYPEELKEFHTYNRNSWNHLRRISKEKIQFFLSKPPEHAWSVKINYPGKYQTSEVEITPPKLETGIYVAVASNHENFSPGNSMIQAGILNISELFLIGSSGLMGPEKNFIFEPESLNQSFSVKGFHVYTVNAITGQPEPDTTIDMFYRFNNTESETSIYSGKDGFSQIEFPINISYPRYNHYWIDCLARSSRGYAWWQNRKGLWYSAPAPVQVYLETDRPIYRPGQKVQFKVTVLRRIPQGYKVYDRDAKINIIARDANRNEFFKKELALNPMGSASDSFTIPTGRLLGNYSIYGTISDFGHSFSGQTEFSVEEYKRPEFEVKLHEAKGVWKYGQKAKIEGSVTYYFGGPVPNAPVFYKIYRQRYIPWYCWWWRWYYPDTGKSEILSNSVKTDSSGKFSFEFVPQPESETYKDYPSIFYVEVESRDTGGRTITSSKSFNAGSKAYLFNIEPGSGFFVEGKSSEVSVRLMNLNEQQVKGTGTYELYLLEKKPEIPQVQETWSGHFSENPSLEQVFKDVPDSLKIESGKLEFYENKPSKINFKNLKQGVYRFRVKTNDPWGGEIQQAIILLVVSPSKKQVSLFLPSITIPEHSSYVVGETAQILLGNSKLKGVRYVEIWGGQFLLSTMVLKEPGISIVNIPVNENHKGGFTVRWFGVSDFQIYSGQIKIDIPYKDRELSVEPKISKVVRPGEKVRWSIAVKDSFEKSQDGEALVRVFDRSLEYYQKESSRWLEFLYQQRPWPRQSVGSVYRVYVTNIPVQIGWIKRMMEMFNAFIKEPQMPHLRITSSRVRGGGRYKYRRIEDGIQMAVEALGEAKFAAAKAASVAMEVEADRAEAKISRQPLPPQVQVRKDFSETAFFSPHLKIKNGKGYFSFKMPERLTSWKITGYCLTPDVKRGIFSKEFVTKKDLMVRIDMPRFFRENDKGQIKAIVSNETKTQLSGNITLIIEEDGKPVAQKYGIQNTNLNWTAKPNGIFTGTWDISVPAGITNLKIRAIARSQSLVDAEERELPILPSRQRLIKTHFVTLDGTQKKTLLMEELKTEDFTRQNESLTLQIDPQLALTIINSLPLLVRYPHECTEQLVNRYVPLSIINSFYRKYPALAIAVKKIPKRKTITPAWDREDPIRLISLMETPWENISKGRESYWPVIDLFDPKTVENEKYDAISKIRSYQNYDGSFPWFPGGRPSLYMTLYVLEGFAEAQKYGVEIPEDVAKKAIAYVTSEIPQYMKPEPEKTSFILYAAYVLTSFPKSWAETKESFKYAKVWADFADKHSKAMTAFGKAYAAYVYLRLGEKNKANLYLDRAMDGSREDPLSGLYWAPEKMSWLWYNDSIEKHAFILRALLALRPKDKKIPPMIKWLLFNRKGNEWKSTKTTAAAIYCLLDVLKTKGALDKGDTYNISWAQERQVIQVEPFDWIAKPLRFVKIGSEITKRFSKVEIDKQGPGFGFASLTFIYSTEEIPKSSGEGIMQLERKFYLRYKEGTDYRLKPLKFQDTVKVGDQIEVHLKINTKSQFEYVHLKDPKAAGFEAEELTSGWKWDKLSTYKEPRDSLTNFFMDWLPHGQYLLTYRLRPTTPGQYRIGPAVIQSMYSPEFNAHSDGMLIKVLE